LKLAEKGFELGLAEVLCQERNEGILIVDLKGMALRTPGDNVGMIGLLCFVQKDVKVRRKMLGVPNLPS